MKDKKTQLGEASDVLDAIGHENEKEGIRWTQHFMNIWDQHELEKRDKKRDRLKKATIFNRMEYHRIVSGMIQDEAKQLDVPVGYMIWSEYTEGGVIARLAAPNGEKYKRAFKPSGDPGVDLNAIFGILVDIQSTVDEIVNRSATNLKKAGFIVP